VTASILSRLGTIDILETAQKVCTTWYKICKDPLMWRTIDLRYDDFPKVYDLGKMCRYAVDRSCGNLVTINLDFFGTDELLKYITDRYSSTLCCVLMSLEFSCVMFVLCSCVVEVELIHLHRVIMDSYLCGVDVN
jgi:hypothetical protein